MPISGFAELVGEKKTFLVPGLQPTEDRRGRRMTRTPRKFSSDAENEDIHRSEENDHYCLIRTNLPLMIQITLLCVTHMMIPRGTKNQLKLNNVHSLDKYKIR